ncbi:CDGSH iron-sulfur domain-containing protein [Mycobacterium sp.]|uniref:CDGSH iron-sulfur domain-containing protein n=1 Tax=Mycobacterium sp. TaxID=1785 RepID=UPI003F95D76A
MTDRTRVQVIPNGPVLISGPVRIETPDGDVVESDRFMVAVCTCRRSKIYPMCDTSHRRCRPVRARIAGDDAQKANSAKRPS